MSCYGAQHAEFVWRLTLIFFFQLSSMSANVSLSFFIILEGCVCSMEGRGALMELISINMYG